nr:MAG TPA: hypothetical protein [Caudoviricetes sp.]
MIIYSHFSLALICGEGWLFACCSVENCIVNVARE